MTNGDSIGSFKTGDSAPNSWWFPFLVPHDLQQLALAALASFNQRLQGGVFILGIVFVFFGIFFASGFLASWLLGFLASWLLGFSASWLLGFSASWLLGFLASWLFGFLASWLLGFSASGLLGFLASWLLGFSASWLLGFSASRLLGFLASWLLGFLASWLLGFLAFRLFGFLASRLFARLCGFWWLFGFSHPLHSQFLFGSGVFPTSWGGLPPPPTPPLRFSFSAEI